MEMTRSRSNGEYITTRGGESWFRTTDLGLATVLIIEGHDPELVQLETSATAAKGHPKGAWEFPANDDLEKIVKSFSARECCVEPVAFQHQLRLTRQELFAFLGMN